MFTFNIKKSLEAFLACFKSSFSRYGTHNSFTESQNNLKNSF